MCSLQLGYYLTLKIGNRIVGRAYFQFLNVGFEVFLSFCFFKDGFRKVVGVDSGIFKLERDGPVEFRHAYFRQGREDLLEHIKRKVSENSVYGKPVLLSIDK